MNSDLNTLKTELSLRGMFIESDPMTVIPGQTYIICITNPIPSYAKTYTYLSEKAKNLIEKLHIKYNENLVYIPITEKYRHL